MRSWTTGGRWTGRLALLVVALCAVGAAAAPARASTDLSFDSLACDKPAVVGYLPDAGEVTTSCDVTLRRHGAASITQRLVRVNIRLDAKEPGLLGLPTTVDSRVVDTYTVLSVLSGTVTTNRTVTLTDRDAITGDPMDPWLAEQLMLGRTLVFSVQADPADAVAETDETNNALSMLALLYDFRLGPLTGELSFGPAPMTLTAGAVVYDAVACPASDGTLDSDAVASWDPGGGFRVQQVAVPKLCVDIASATVDGVALAAASGASVSVPSLAGKLGGLTAEASVTLGTAGVSVGALTLELPGKHTFHQATATGPRPGGSRKVALGTITQPGKDTLAGLVGSTTGGYLHVEPLPFYLVLSTLTAKASAVTGTHAGARWVHTRSYDLDDPRHSLDPAVVNVASNDARWAVKAAQAQPVFALSARGLSATVSVGAGVAAAHFPRVRTLWQGTDLRITGGQLTRTALPPDLAQTFEQRSACASCTTPGEADVDWGVVPVGQLGLAPDGAVIAEVEGLSDAAWGPYDAGVGHVFERSGDTELRGVLAIPGFSATGTGGSASAASYLLGAREVRRVGGVTYPTTAHLLEDDQTQRGNHFVAGVTVGPQWYDRGGAPKVGRGVTLEGTTETRVRLGGLSQPGACGGGPCALVSNEATRFIVRPGGVTGVFDTDSPPLPTVYGFELPLLRFAFRQVSNALDPVSGVEGSVSVPAPGDFTVAFESLALECTGALGEALVVPCPPGAPADAPNCGEALGAWSTRITPLALEFAADAGDAACDPGGRDLEVGMDLAIHALSKPLGLTAAWSPAGEPSDERITGSTSHVLDADADAGREGFPVALHADPRLEWASDSDGWYAFGADFAVPFFDALTTDIRVANATLDTAAATFVRAPGADWAVDGACTRAAFPTDDAALEACAPTAHYTWGGTGFGLDLQAWYDASTAAFTGITKEHSVAVMGVRAVADRITPDGTTVRFGASAEIEKLELSTISLSVDLDDEASIALTDQTLASLGIGGSPIGSLVNPIRTALDEALTVAGASLDLQLRGVVDAAFEAASGGMAGVGAEAGLDAMARLLAEVRGLPATFAAEASLSLDELRADLVVGFDAALDVEATALFQAYVSIMASAEVAPCDAAPGTCEAALAQVQRLRDALAAARAVLAAVQGRLDEARDAVTGLVASAQALEAEASAFVATLQSALFVDDPTLTGFVSADVGTNDLLVVLLVVAVGALREPLEELEVVDLVSRLSSFAELVPLPATASEAQGDIRGRAEELLADLDQTIVSFEGQVTASGFADILDLADGYLDDIAGILALLHGQLGTLELALSSPFDALSDELDAADTVLANVDAVLAGLEADIVCVMDPGCGGIELRGALALDIEAALNGRIFAATGGALEFVATLGGGDQSFVIGLSETLTAPIDLAIADIAAKVEGELAVLFDLPDVATGAELRTILVDLVMNTPAIEGMILTFQGHFDLLVADISGLVTDLFDQVEAVLADLAAALNDVAAGVLADASAVIDGLSADLPVKAATIDGVAVIAGDELERLHVGAEFTLSGSEDEDTRSFEATLDVTSWSSNGKGDACASGESGALLDAVISTSDLPLRIGTGTVTIETLELGFTLDGSSGVPAVVGLFGGITTDGGLDFDALRIYDIAFAAGAGDYETYVGAKATAAFSSAQLSVGFLVGRTCTIDVLETLDPQVARFITLPASGFAGAYVRGSADMPIIDTGCLLNLSLTADVGSWFLAGPPVTIGGLVGGGAYGKFACIGALRGQATAFLEKSGSTVKFEGEGFAVAGAGIKCDPETWKTVAKSRQDKGCGTGDASVSLTWNGKWNVPKPSVSAVH